MKAQELREKYLDFFKQKGHAIIPGASLIPEHDPTVLFTTAGMHPLVPFLLGEKHPSGQRLVNVQKCIRTGDIDSVGDAWHLTFFEMLGNWSLGDYWKEEAINWSFEFLTSKKWLGIPINKLNVTVFGGDKDAPRDEESAKVWQKLGIPKQRIYFLPKEENWWGPAGQTGPCGPCTEMFYDTGKDKCGSECRPGCGCGKYIEIWNDVFMEYNKRVRESESQRVREYEFAPLKQKNVDTGMGVERTIAVLNGQDNVYETELFKPIIREIKRLAKIVASADSFNELFNPGQAASQKLSSLKDRAEKERALRIIADHLKAATFILAQDVEPSNSEQGYVLRRLIRRAVRYGQQLEIESVFTHKVASVVANVYRKDYPELLKNKEFIEEQLAREEDKFSKTLKKGLKEFQRMVEEYKKKGRFVSAADHISGKDVFNLYQTYGFPVEMTMELAAEEGFVIDQEGFNRALGEHQELSRAGAEQKFKGGLADHSEQVTKYHTATHLLLAALRQVLGQQVEQRGSNLTAERLRFDFSHSEKMTPEQIQKVENLVNEKIEKDLGVKCEEMLLSEAKKQKATGIFEKKYRNKVKVYTIFNTKTGEVTSKEICGGPHVKNTGILGRFKIIKEESSSTGVRRIKAVLG